MGRPRLAADATGQSGVRPDGCADRSRHPRHPIGWLLSVASLLSVTLAADAYSIWVLQGGGPGSAYLGPPGAWAAPLLGWPAFAALVLVFLIAPDGHLPSPRWRWAVWVTLAGLVPAYPRDIDHTARGTSSTDSDDSTRAITEPSSPSDRCWSPPGSSPRPCPWWCGCGGRGTTTPPAAVDRVVAVLLAVGVVVILVVPRVPGVEGTWLAAMPLRLAQVAVPLCVAVAVLRHRLLRSTSSSTALR